MPRSPRRFQPLILLALTALLFSMVAAPVTAAPKPKSAVGSAEKTVIFASDGMRPDLMQKYAKDGYMPTYKELMKKGVTGDNGMLQAFPPNTGVGWYTMATGAYPADHGSTNNTYFRQGDAFNNRTSFSAADTMQADTIANAAERAGKKVAQIDWVGGAAAKIAGPTVDFTNFFSNRGVLVGQANTTEQNGSAFFGVTYQVASTTPVVPGEWTAVPLGDPLTIPKQTTWSINSTFAAQNPNRTYNVYFYDSVADATRAFDRVIVSPVGKTGAAPSITLSLGGGFVPLKHMGANGLIGARAGQTVGHYIKLIDLAPDASQFKLYDTSLARAIATCGAVCNTPLTPAGGAGEDRLEKYIADNLLPWAAADFAPEEAGVVDEDTYVEQGRDLERAYSLQVINFILGTLQPNTDLAMVGYPFTDEVSHQFMGLVSPTDADGNPNPCYDAAPKFDDVQCTPNVAGRVAIREGYIRSAYQDADEKLGITRALMGGNPTTFAGSDHGFAPAYYSLNAQAVLNEATVTSSTDPSHTAVSLHASNGNASNCGATATDIAKGCWAGGTIQIYINAARLRNAAVPATATFPSYDEVRAAIKAAFAAVTDPAHPGAQVILRIMDKEELRNVDGSDSLHPNRSGDVVVVTRPPYQSDAGANGVKISLSHFFGQHGYLPNTVDLANNINMHGTFVLAGPGVKHKDKTKNLRAVDMAPTVSLLMGIPGPMNARGAILYDILEHGEKLHEVTILDISDWHGQLTPLSDAADTIPATPLSFPIGGAAFLKPWFDTYTAEAVRSSGDKKAPVITMQAGDTIGATPPLSNFFGDRPAIEVSNMMGIDIDGLGNHNFDYGAPYFRSELVPLSNHPFVSANIVDANGKTPAEWAPSHTFKFGHGVEVSIVGFSNDDIPSLTKPGSLDPFHVANSLAAVNAEAAKVNKKADVVIAIGHLGATAGTLTAPTGPLLDLANGVSNVDVVVGDHTDQQALTWTGVNSTGVLVTENRSKGLRFTRIRIVVGDGKDGVVYRTADFHKPWTIGITPDPAITAKINELNALAAPIFNTEVGKSTVVIPRADACTAATGRVDGRACESLIGDLVTDAIRSANTTDFALTNSGGLRANLTCPTTDDSQDFCPATLYPVPDANGKYPITRGQVLGVLPFGNQSATLSINGAELKDYLETAVSSLPATGNGRFGQVSGLCFTFDIEGTPATFTAPGATVTPGSGNRVLGAVRQAADGSCTGAAISFSAGVTYTLTTNDFTASGGDGYPNFRSRMTTKNILDQDLADFIAAQPSGTVSPVIQHRVHCTDSIPGGGAAACPVGSP